MPGFWPGSSFGGSLEAVFVGVVHVPTNPKWYISACMDVHFITLVKSR